jgi:uncharacterized protein (DUF58 family)
MRRAPQHEDDSRYMYGELLDAVRGLRWRARRASRIAIPGIHQSRVRGTSTEFTQYRPYRHGADLRRIDWKLFARSDRAHVRVSEERAVTPTCIVLDASASMDYPLGLGSKWSLARQVAVALTAVAHAGGDPTGVMVSGNPDLTIQPRTRRGIIAEMIRTLQDVKVAGAEPVAASVILAARTASRVVILSDFLGDLDDTMRAARQVIASGRDVYALHVVAAEEVDPPASVSMVMDPEVAELHRSLSPDTRGSYVRAFAKWREETSFRWLASGAAYRAIVVGREPASYTVRRIVRDETMTPRGV